MYFCIIYKDIMKTTIFTFALVLNFLSCNNSTQAEQVINQNKVNQIEISELKDFAKLNNTIILDVRTPEEFQKGFIPNAKHINYYDKDFKNQLAQLDKSNTYIVYCKSGFRSQKASQLMIDLGFKNVYDLIGGYDAWIN